VCDVNGWRRFDRKKAREQPFVFPALMYGLLLTVSGFAAYFFVVLSRFLSRLVGLDTELIRPMQLVLWYSGVPVVAGILLICFDLFILLPRKRARLDVTWDPPGNLDLTVVLTAYNDELSIQPAVQDFLQHSRVKRVIVVDNNSKDRTREAAHEAGAIVVCETRAGYGNCVYRALSEGVSYGDTELTLLCEGDMTFRAYDIDKFLAYIPHGDIVNGTRIVEQLRERQTQLTTFMYYGNFFAGKLLEAKHVGQGTFTDVGTTYKLCRNSALEVLLAIVNREINLEFNAHLLDIALANGLAVLECPVTFHARVGLSKGGNVSNLRALKVGTRMISGIIFGWRKQR
jgi:hypothetical protein